MSSDISQTDIQPAIDRVLETCLYVDDLNVAEVFYRDVLGLRLITRQENRHVFFRCGQSMLLIFDPKQSSHADPEQSSHAHMEVPPHGAHGAGHAAFAIDAAQWDAWQRRFSEHGVQIETVIEWPQGGRSMYFRDPAGNSLELATPSVWGLAN